ncbi:MAG: DNA gyrase C-terminal beta-propeller domain-containing protein, partial [Clostridia bacterium]|nr:DNA gyrase C-terminal beta-propeller domain-containing protein [Clostridia bacterium]
TLSDDEEVIGTVNTQNDMKLLTVSETGFGRISKFSEYRVQSRGGKGIINYPCEKYGKVSSIMSVSEKDDIIIMSENGVIIRINVEQIRECSRTSKGVRLMRIKDDNRVVSVAKVENKEDDEIKNQNTNPDTSN